MTANIQENYNEFNIIYKKILTTYFLKSNGNIFLGIKNYLIFYLSFPYNPDEYLCSIDF
jgi:hypothetical protein